jgi:MOSC domain-containing protein YiiM
MTSIYKSPAAGRVAVRWLNLDGDEQSDLTVHGGVDKAVYVYPSEHYAFWKNELPDAQLEWGAFGENFTISGLLESTVQIGDRLRIGTAEFTVTQPRMPCFKLGIKFGRDAIIKRFLESRRSGFYLRVEREGEVGAGDAIETIKNAADSVSITEFVGLYGNANPDPELLRRAIAAHATPESWREYFRKRLSQE